MDPTEVKTVSNNKVSALTFNLACWLVIKESLLQEYKIIGVRNMDAINFNKAIIKFNL
jgi:hypothetical protein